MPIPLYIFPTPPEAICVLRHDTAGWTLTAHPATHPSGRQGQAFDIPDGTPNANGCALNITASKKVPIDQRGTLFLAGLPDGAGLLMDDFHLQDAKGSLPRLVAQGQFLVQE